jgi:hypothetical protein
MAKAKTPASVDDVLAELAAQFDADLSPYQKSELRRVAELKVLAAGTRAALLGGVGNISMADLARIEETSSQALLALNLPPPKRPLPELQVQFIDPPNPHTARLSAAAVAALEQLLASEADDGALARATVEAADAKTKLATVEAAHTEAQQLVAGLRKRCEDQSEALRNRPHERPDRRVVPFAGAVAGGDHIGHSVTYLPTSHFGDHPGYGGGQW